ncbi:Hsp70 protein [Aphelenchoides avenae]|nr:Hsp70 protein [Aphelenchus avenae]
MDIVRGEEGRPAVRVEYYGESRPVLLEEVVAMTMVELKERIEKVVGHPMTDVVLTVPQCFGDSQRRALRDAATIAGLNVVRLLNETTTAAITYSHRCEHNDREHVLVVDVGGGSVNVAVVEVTASPVNVKSTAGSCCLGAEEFDRTLTDYCLDELAQNNGIDVGKLGVRSRKRLQRQLKSQCVEARQTLYSSSTARIKLDINGAEVQLDVSREVFDAFNEANFDRIRALIKAAIHDAPTDGRFFNAVYLIGGGSRVIALEKAITSLLPGTRLVKTFYRDEAVIKGAAVFASHFGSDGAGFKVIDVLGRSVLLDANQLQEIFAPNASEYSNGAAHQIGTFVIGELPGQKLTKGQVHCTFRIDENGLLNMSATQEAAHSQVPFSKASFRVQLAGSTRRFLCQSIAICESDGTMVPIIEASRYDIPLPVTDGKVFLQRDGSPSEMQFLLYEGNSLYVKRCTFLGTLSVALPNVGHGTPMVELTASVDRSFLLTASATCIPPAQVERLIVVPHQWSLPYSVTSMLAQELASKRAASEAKNALHLYCYELGVKIEEKELDSSGFDIRSQFLQFSQFFLQRPTWKAAAETTDALNVTKAS